MWHAVGKGGSYGTRYQSRCDGAAVDSATGVVSLEPHKYLHNLLRMPAVAAVLLGGAVLVLWSIGRGWCGRRDAVWYGGAGTILAVTGLLLTAGWGDTAYYPSLVDLQSSLTIRNSSSSRFTLTVMSWVSLLIPFVAAYIWYAWRAINRTPISREELCGGGRGGYRARAQTHPHLQRGRGPFRL